VTGSGELEQILETLRALPKSERRAAALFASEDFGRAVELLEAQDDKGAWPL
jgi:hypothetical protein